MWWSVVLSSVLSRALDTEHRASARYTGSPLLFLSAAVVVDFLPRSGLAQAAATFNSTLDASHQRAAARPASLHVISLKKVKRNKYLGTWWGFHVLAFIEDLLPSHPLLICLTSLQSTVNHLRSHTSYCHNVSLHARDPPGPGLPQWLRRLPLIQRHHEPASLRSDQRETRRVVQRSSKAASPDSRHPDFWCSRSMCHISLLLWRCLHTRHNTN